MNEFFPMKTVYQVKINVKVDPEEGENDKRKPMPSAADRNRDCDAAIKFLTYFTKKADPKYQ